MKIDNHPDARPQWGLDEADVIVDAGVYTARACYRRENSRFAPHNLVFDSDCGREASPSAGAARPIFAFGDPVTSHADGRTIEVAMDGVRVGWEYDEACMCYFRTQNGRAHVAASDTQISATNVVVMRVGYVPSPVDARSPEARTEGSGLATVFRGGVRFDGEWFRPDAFSPFAFGSGGVPMTLPPGTTFIELARPDA